MGLRGCTLEKMVISLDFWKNKKVLLTGHTGFKGSWLSIWLKKLGVELIGFSKDIPTEPSLFELAKVSEDMTSIIGDIRDFSAIQKIIQENQPEIIIHMAAQALVRKSYEDPLNTFSTNIMGTANLLEAVRGAHNTKVVINVTSDKCYNNIDSDHDFVEEDPMGGYDPYSSSKGCSELITSAFRNSFFNSEKYNKHGLALASVRAGNVIGGGDWSRDRLVPDIIQNINKKTIIIRNPNAVRPWQYVLEPLNGYMLLIEKLWDNGEKYSEGWNFGPDKNESKSVSYILDKISENLNKKIEWEQDEKSNLHEASKLILNCSKAKNKLKWNSKTNTDQAIKFTMNWYKAYESRHNMKDFSVQQIKEFELL